MPLIDDLLKWIKELYTTTGSTSTHYEKIKYITTRMESISALFYSNIPRKYRHKLGVTYDGLVAMCTFMGKECTQDNFKHYLHPDFVNCYTFQAKHLLNTGGNSLFVGPQKGLSLILRSEPKFNMFYSKFDMTKNAESSVRVSVHAKNTVPFMMSKGFDIVPGKSSSIALVMKSYERLSAPYTNCKGKKEFEIDSRSFIETSDSCQEKCIIQAIREKCNCTSTMFEDLMASEHDYCLTFRRGYSAEMFNNRSVCEIQFSESKLKLDCSRCVWDCREIDYELQMTSADWPQECTISNFLDEYLRIYSRPCNDTVKMYYTLLRRKANLTLTNSDYVSPSVNSEFYDYDYSDYACELGIPYHDSDRKPFSIRTILNSIEDPVELFQYAQADYLDRYFYTMDIPEKYYSMSSLNELKKTWVKESFYRLNVYFRQIAVEQHTQVASFSFADMWSGVGGILGLWAGLSVMTIIEIITFICKLFGKCCKNSSKSNMIHVAKSEKSGDFMRTN